MQQTKSIKQLELKLEFLTDVDKVKLAYKPLIKPSKRPKINSSKNAVLVLMPHYEECMEHYEMFTVLHLNRGNKVLGIQVVSTGGISGTVVDIRLVAQASLLLNASSAILAHNHPSGNIKPSSQDITLTKNAKEAFKLFDIAVLDHVILTSEGSFSFADESML
jgi:DNA repair protein RadC